MLTTRCPHCSTVFRIRPEQLSVRSGRVRCGHCQQAFSALAHLEELDDEELQPASAPARPATPVPAAVKAVPAAPQVAQPSPPPPPPAPAPAPEPVPVAAAPLKPWPVPDAEVEPPAFVATDEARSTLILPEPAAMPVERAPEAPEAPAVGDDFTMNIQLDGPSPAEVRAELGGELTFDFAGLDETAPAEAAKPPPAPAAPYESKIARELGVGVYDPSQDQVFGQTVMLEEPIEIVGLSDPDRGPDSLFDERERQQQSQRQLQVEDRRGRKPLWLWLGGVLLLLLLAGLQLTYVFRTELTRWVPESRPWLEEACAVLACSVPYPQVIAGDMIVIDGSSFTPDAALEGRFRLAASILNKAPFDQAWPHLELTITDRFDIAIARRVFKPEEWLPAVYASLPAFEANSEVTANLVLDLDKLPASGYRLYVFYP